MMSRLSFKPKQAPITVAAACLAIFIPGALVFGFPGVMGTHWQQTFGATQADLGKTLFFVLAAVGAFMFLAGRLQEKIGLISVMVLGALFYGTSTILVAYARGLYSIYVWAFLTGAASALVYLPALTVVQIWYPHRRGLVTGLVSMFFGVSGAVMAPVFSWGVLRFEYTPFVRFTGLVLVALGLVAAAFIRFPRSGNGTTGETSEPLPGVLSLTYAQSLKTRSFWLLWIVYAFVGAAGIAMVTLSIKFGASRGLKTAHAVFLLMAFNVTNGLSRLISGYLSDRVGLKNIMGTAFILAGFAYYLFPYVDGILIWALLAATIGFAFGTLFAVSAPLVGACFGMKHFGSIFGTVFTAFGFVSGAIGPWLGGYWLDQTANNFTPVFIYLGSLMVCSAALVWMISPHTECRF